jgi:hypothetical protein
MGNWKLEMVGGEVAESEKHMPLKLPICGHNPCATPCSHEVLKGGQIPKI